MLFLSKPSFLNLPTTFTLPVYSLFTKKERLKQRKLNREGEKLSNKKQLIEQIGVLFLIYKVRWIPTGIRKNHTALP